MAHSAPPPPGRRWYEIAGGVAILVLAVAVGLFAVLALRHPGAKTAHSVGPGPTSGAATAPPTSSPSRSETGTDTTSPALSPPTSSSAGGTQAASTPASQTNPAIRPSVVVLNNTGRPSLSTLAVARLRAGGWTVADGGAFDGAILSTAVYYDPSSQGAQAAAAAVQTQFPQIKRVKQKFAGLPEGPLVLIVTDDYS